MAAVHRPACASCSSLLLASLLLIAMAILALAAVGKGVGEPDPDPERGGGSPMDCPIECASKLTGYIMETIKCYAACMGGGGGELSAAEEKHAAAVMRGACRQRVLG